MLYAAYGSNLHPLRLTARISSAQLMGTSFLPGWSLHFHKRGGDGSAKCSILPDGDGVHVAVFDVGPRDKLELDRIEGVGFGYSEILLSVPNFGDCASYIAAESHIEASLEPYDWYKEFVLLGARTHGFPNDYLHLIDSLPASRDPDLSRRVRQWKTVELVKVGR